MFVVCWFPFQSHILRNNVDLKSSFKDTISEDSVNQVSFKKLDEIIIKEMNWQHNFYMLKNLQNFSWPMCQNHFDN